MATTATIFKGLPIRLAHFGSIRHAPACSAAKKRLVREDTTTPRFLHLLHGGTPRFDPPAIEAPKAALPLTSGELAARILQAGEKARSPTGTGVAPPSGLAAKIVQAGCKRRAHA